MELEVEKKKKRKLNKSEKIKNISKKKKKESRAENKEDLLQNNNHQDEDIFEVSTCFFVCGKILTKIIDFYHSSIDFFDWKRGNNFLGSPEKGK